MAVAAVLPDPLWSHLMQYIPSLSTYSTSESYIIPLLGVLPVILSTILLLLSLSMLLIVEIPLLPVLQRSTSENQNSPQHLRFPNSIAEEILDELPCCVTQLWYSLVGTIIL